MFNFLGNLHNTEIADPLVSFWAAQTASSLPRAREGNENKARYLHFHGWQFNFQGVITDVCIPNGGGEMGGANASAA